MMRSTAVPYAPPGAGRAVDRYLPLVKHLAAKLAFNLPPTVEYADLVSMGLVGLLDAMSKFDAKRGIKFETYATYRIRGEILNQLNALSWVPRGVREKARKIEDESVRLQKELGRAPSAEELAAAVRLSPHEYERLLGAAGPAAFLTLDEALSDDNGKGPRAADGENPEKEAERRLLAQELALLLQELPDKERIVVSLYFYEDLTLKEAGKVLGVTESRACQLLSQATARLRGRLRWKGVE